MIQKILVIFGLVLFVNQLFIKKGIWTKIQERGSISRFEWIYKLTSCKFCLIFHLCWMVTFFYGVFNGFEWCLLIVPFVVSGLTRLMTKDDL